MKKSIAILSIAAIMFASCGDKKKEEAKDIEAAPVEEVAATGNSAGGDIALGEKLFAEKTCTTCHQKDQKVIGPSIKDIHKIYAEKGADIVAFLKGESPAIVDTDPGQVAIMKANLDSFVKDLSQDELAAISAYMSSVE
ncbi:MAG: c-type cytochrome [Lutibacter sp.]|nr:c-type cytochrome [Lutibacter sp.]MBP9601044.1 c-type cytochrome [Lutibacter sp.]